MEQAMVVDINKLRYLTQSVPQSPKIKNSVDFSDFAAKNFERTVGVTRLPKNEHVRRENSKWVYNEVQRNSINFGISAEEMIAYHNNKMKKGSQKSPSNLPNLGTPEPRNENINEDLNLIGEASILKSPFALSTNSPQFNDSDFVQFIAKSTPPPRPRTRPPALNISNRSREIGIASAHRTPPTITPLSKSRRSSLLIETPTKQHSINADEISPLTRSSSLKNLERKKSASFSKHNSLIDIKDQLKSKLSPSSMRRRSSQFSLNSSRPVSAPIPTQRECHSVEETLLADEEFNDFTVPPNIKSRTSSYYAKTNEFDFEKPLSRTTSAGSLNNPNLNKRFSSQLNSPTFKPALASPITPTRLKQRHSVAAFQTAIETTGSPGVKNTRSLSTNDSFGSSPVRYSPRMSWRTSLSDLKGSPIQKISEHEILQLDTPQ